MPTREIALVTHSGKAYFQLTSALKRKKIAYYSLTPTDEIPRHVKAVITTEAESQFVTHPTTFVYSNEDPHRFINHVIRYIQGKKQYAQVAIGIDPGHQFGLAILGDGILLETKIIATMKDVATTLQSLLFNYKAKRTIIKIGNGNPSLSTELSQLLQDQLKTMDIEIVDEYGTTKNYRRFSSYNRTSKDIYSAIRISHRKGERVD